MNYRAVVFLSILCASVCGFSQTESSGFKKGAHKAITTSTGPVTVGEAAATFDRLRGLFKKVLKINAPSVLHSGSSSRVVTRAEVLDAMTLIYKSAEPQFTNTPKLVPVEYKRIRPDSASVKPKLIKLIQRGCVAGYGPLAMGSKKTLTVNEFGDAIGIFYLRIAEMTNHFDTKWSPYLKDPSKPE